MDDFENLIIDEDDEDEQEDVDDKDEDVFKADEDGLNFNFSEIAKKSDANSNNSNNGVLAVVEDAGRFRDPSAEGTGRKGASYLNETLLPN